jgi:predicted transcriptional regulator
MPDAVKADVEAAMQESERGEGMSHEEVKKTYSQWFAK